jgi:hypothetical protein
MRGLTIALLKELLLFKQIEFYKYLAPNGARRAPVIVPGDLPG